MAADRRGRFVVFEGIDGAGTTTQRDRARSWLQGLGHTVHATAEPSRGPVGRLLREVLAGRVQRPDAPDDAERGMDPAAVALLFAADRLDHVRAEIEPRRRAGEDVLCDRYVLSSLAYQGSEVDPAFVRTVNARAPEPDLTVFLRVRPERAAERVSDRGTAPETYERMEVQRRVAERYEAMLGELDPRSLTVVDGEGAADEVEARVREALEPLLGG